MDVTPDTRIAFESMALSEKEAPIMSLRSVQLPHGDLGRIMPATKLHGNSVPWLDCNFKTLSVDGLFIELESTGELTKVPWR